MDHSAPLPAMTVTWSDVYGDGSRGEEPFLSIPRWVEPVQYFCGQNGSGKSKTARAIANKLREQTHYLETDRLMELMGGGINYGWVAVPAVENFEGLPLGTQQRANINSYLSQGRLGGMDDIYQLRERPDVWIQVAAFLRRTLGKTLELREVSGYLDPVIMDEHSDYSLFRNEGHGIRELVVLLVAIYRPDWDLLVVDEPELHLHPSMVRLFAGELIRVCETTGRHAILVTHEPSLIEARSSADLAKIWFFNRGRAPRPFVDAVEAGTQGKLTASLTANPKIPAQLIFSPRPVLVEGKLDLTAFTTAMSRKSSQSASQTDLVDCGGNRGVLLWSSVARRLGLSFRAVADLDTLFDPARTAMDERPEVAEAYTRQLTIEPANTSRAMQDIVATMAQQSVPKDPKSRAAWLCQLSPESGHGMRRDAILDIWRRSGLWLHPQGTIEDVLGCRKNEPEIVAAANVPGAIDNVVDWFSYRLDPAGEVETLMNVRVEKIAHEIMETLRQFPERSISGPVGATAEFDSKIVSVVNLGEGRYRITVELPESLAGYSLEFSRQTPATDLILSPPEPGLILDDDAPTSTTTDSLRA